MSDLPEARKIEPAGLEELETLPMSDLLQPERIANHLLTKASKMTMSDKKGIKETKDLLQAAKITAIAIVAEISDGLSPLDAVNVVLDGDVRSSWVEAAKGIEEVDNEIRDLDREEIFDLLRESVDISEELLTEILE